MKKEKELTGYPHIDKPWMKYREGELIAEEPNTNMVEVLKQRNKWRGNKIAYEYYGRKVTYDEFFRNVDIASKILKGIGVKKEDIILNMVPNIPEEEQLWFGATQIGAISDYIDPRPDSMDIMANAKKLLEIIKFEKPKYIIAVDKCYLGMIRPIESELKTLGITDIIILNPADSMDEKGQIDYLIDLVNYERLKDGEELLKNNCSIDYIMQYEVIKQRLLKMKQENALLDECIKSSSLNIYKYRDLVQLYQSSSFNKINDAELINYIGHTSGTSGARPKPIALSNKNAISSMVQCEPAGVGPKEGETSLHLLPGFAPFGRYNNGIQTYYNRGINIHVPEFVFGEFGYLIKKYKPNAFMTPPAFLTSLPDCKYLQEEDLSFINKVTYGGDSMTERDEERINLWLKEHGSNAEVEKGHGMSEYCGCGTYAKDAYNKIGTIGIPISRTIYTIVNPEIEDHLEPLKFEDGCDKLRGEIVVSANHVTNGLLHGEVIVPHQTMEMDGRDYIRTRDIGYMDRDGCFFIDERKGRAFARLDGFKIKPSEIEREIKSNSYVKNAVIVDYYDENVKGIMPICHLVLNEGNLTDDEQVGVIKDIVYNSIIANPTMSSRQIPSKFKIRVDMPLNKGNKIDFVALRNEPLDGEEVNVIVDETNIAVGSIEIFKNKEKGKEKIKG